MTSSGPRFLDEDRTPAPAASIPASPEPAPVVTPTLPRGPVLLEPEANAPGQLDVAWMPQSITGAPRKAGAASWIAAGLATIVLSLAGLTVVAWLRVLLFQSAVLGSAASLAITAGLLLIAYGGVLEWRAYRALWNTNSPRAVVVSICSVSERNAMPRPLRSVTVVKRCGNERPSRSSFGVLDCLEEIAGQTGKTIPQVAINWLLRRPTVATVIIGARDEKQILENLGAVGWSLTDDQVAAPSAASTVYPLYPQWHQRR